ncbi:MAG: Glu/Leu/Phe/Val dehydrogenase [Alphaproteobacteria bacterium]|nr:Glu/Leu/Phe/Val dehydrogenase [Alphaproteobacteria bacterium]
MSIFSQPGFDNHEAVHAFNHPEAGLQGIIAIHSTALGPAFGGCRFWTYANDSDALTDALRLSQGMSYKNALAELPYGGGKAVIMRGNGAVDVTALFEAYGRVVETLGGRYITAEDVGTSVENMRSVAKFTSYVSGIPKKDGYKGGDPSPVTALGVFEGMKAAARHQFGTDDLAGMTVAVQGIGHVGYHLCSLLHEAGAELLVSDINTDNEDRAISEFSAKPVTSDKILSAAADIFAPCALGGVLNVQTIPTLKAKVVAGAANNQLATKIDGQLLSAAGITYAPDYVINAGGIISVAAERTSGATKEGVLGAVKRIGKRTGKILSRASQSKTPPSEMADQMAREIIAKAKTTTAKQAA